MMYGSQLQLARGCGEGVQLLALNDDLKTLPGTRDDVTRLPLPVACKPHFSRR
jgi:hypothetical protein